jgi:hypothetical protein
MERTVDWSYSIFVGLLNAGLGCVSRRWGKWLWRALKCWASFHSAQPTALPTLIQNPAQPTALLDFFRLKALDMRKTSKYWAEVLFVALLTTSCSSGIERFGNLETRVQQYYTYEKNNEWEKAYGMRTPAFRRTVPIELYLSEMKKDNNSWHLDDIQILHAKEKNGKVYVTIKFSETAPISIVSAELRMKMASPGASTIQTERTEDGVWMRVDNEWFCYDAVSRSHLSMNVPLVSE